MKRFPFFGLFLIIIGGVLLLRELHVFNASWKLILWGMFALCGAVMFMRGFSKSEGGKVFFGTLVFLFGLYNLLRSFDFIEIHHHTFFSIVFIIVGFAFLMMGIAERSWWSLIPSMLIGGMGVVFLLDEYGYIDSWDVWENAHTFWPIVLIVIGAIIILRSRRVCN